MPLTQRNAETIRVGTTAGLVADATSFVFDGTDGKPDYRFYQPIFFEYGGRSPMIPSVDYSWNYLTGTFNLLQPNDKLRDMQYYTVTFQPYDSIFVNPSSMIDFTYFIRKINIPNIDVTINQRNGPILERLNSFIAQYEPECLTNILGYELYKVLLTENSIRSNNLIYGAEFVDDEGFLKKWRGLVYTPKVSLIANYIYYRFQEDSSKQTTGVSTSVSDTPSGKSTSPEYKMLDAWNFFSSETKEMVSFLWNQNRFTDKIYPEFSDAQCYRTLEFSRPANFLGI